MKMPNEFKQLQERIQTTEQVKPRAKQKFPVHMLLPSRDPDDQITMAVCMPTDTSPVATMRVRHVTCPTCLARLRKMVGMSDHAGVRTWLLLKTPSIDIPEMPTSIRTSRESEEEARERYEKNYMEQWRTSRGLVEGKEIVDNVIGDNALTYYQALVLAGIITAEGEVLFDTLKDRDEA